MWHLRVQQADALRTQKEKLDSLQLRKITHIWPRYHRVQKKRSYRTNNMQNPGVCCFKIGGLSSKSIKSNMFKPNLKLFGLVVYLLEVHIYFFRYTFNLSWKLLLSIIFYCTLVLLYGIIDCSLLKVLNSNKTNEFEMS